jgi:MoxR-like ATPase
MNTLLIGDTGTGKTHAIRSLATKLKVPYIRVNLDAMVTVEDLIGEFKPSEKGFVWQDGVLTRLVRSGGIFVCDEINAAPPEVLFVLHGLLDDDRQIVLRQKDGEVLKAHPNFWFIATMNPDYEGTKPLNQALYDRFQVTLNYDYDKRTESKLVKSEKLLELAKKFRQMYVKGEIATPCSTRQLIQYEENKKIFGADLANEIFVNRFATEERKPVREALDMEFSTTGKSKMPDKPEDDANANDSN